MTTSPDETRRNIESLLERFDLYAGAAGFSDNHKNNVRKRLGLFSGFLGGIKDVRDVTADDFLSFSAGLRDRPRWPDLRTESAKGLSNYTIPFVRDDHQGFLCLVDETGPHR